VGRVQVVAFQAEATTTQPVGKSDVWGVGAAVHGNAFRHRLIPLRVVPSQQGAGTCLRNFTHCVRAHDSALLTKTFAKHASLALQQRGRTAWRRCWSSSARC
jgi:hypothetical protein